MDLSGTLLALHSWGQSDPSRFRWFEPPDADRLAAADRLLVAIGALDGEPRRITPIGRRILGLPIHPRLSRLLLASVDAGRVATGAAVAALLSEKDIRARTIGQGAGPPATTSASDVLVRLDLLAEAEAARFLPVAAGSRHRPGSRASGRAVA